jgi:alkylation response protein AidB-like acyl-CoA dehydrogenase
MTTTSHSVEQEFRALARRYAQAEIKPNVSTWMREGIFPGHVVKALGAMGMLGATFPERHGGTAVGFLNMVHCAEEIGYACPDLVTLFNMNAMTAPLAILNWGSPDQHERYVTPLIQGELVGGFALTEASGGSDVLGSVRTRAVRDGDDWLLDGTKMFITLSPVADVALLFAQTDPQAGHRGFSAFVVHYDDPGITVNPIAMSGLGKVIPVGEVVLSETRIPGDRLVGNVGEGFKIAMNALDYGRIAVAVKSLATAQVLLDESVGYAQNRRAFGQPLGSFQLIKRQLADMQAEISAGRALLYQAAEAHDAGVAATRLSALAKYFLGEVALRCADAAMEIFGGYALTDEYPLTHYLNLAHLGRTGEGSANILRLALADDVLGLKSMDRHAIRTAG